MFVNDDPSFCLHRDLGPGSHAGSLCYLCVLCVSVVNSDRNGHHRDTADTEVARRLAFKMWSSTRNEMRGWKSAAGGTIMLKARRSTWRTTTDYVASAIT